MVGPTTYQASKCHIVPAICFEVFYITRYKALYYLFHTQGWQNCPLILLISASLTETSESVMENLYCGVNETGIEVLESWHGAIY